jgi:hypothetical protein
LILRRRQVLAGAAATFLPAAALAGGTLADTSIGAIRAALAAMPPGPALLNSYIVAPGPDPADFDLTQANAAYVYDNALAGLALIAAGHVAEARRIGDALAFAQAHDRFYKDGRLRNAYQAGAMTAPARLPGWWDKTAQRWNEDPYQVGTQSRRQMRPATGWMTSCARRTAIMAGFTGLNQSRKNCCGRAPSRTPIWRSRSNIWPGRRIYNTRNRS